MQDKQLDLLLSEGEHLIAQNRLRDALNHYKKLCGMKPDSAEAWFMLGAVNLAAGTPEQARDCSHKATELDSDFPEAWLVLGKAQAMLKNLPAAEESMRRAINLWPEYTEARLNLAITQYEQGKPESALETYATALAQKPESIEGWQQRAALEEKLNQPVDAELSSRRALMLDPTSVETRLILARSLLSQGCTEEAIHEFEHILNQQPRDRDTLEIISTALERLGRLDKAVNAVQKALAIDPESASNWFRLALLDYQQGNLKLALKHSQKCTNLRPDFEPVCVLQGDLFRAMGKLNDALASYESVIGNRGADANANAVAGKAMVLDKLGRHDDAYNALRPHLYSGHVSNKLAVAYANICSHAGSCEEAIEILKGLLSNPLHGEDARQEMFNHQELNYCIAKLYDKLSIYDLAFTHYTIANNYQKRTSPFDPEKHLIMVEEIISDYSRQSLKLAPTSSSIQTVLYLFLVCHVQVQPLWNKFFAVILTSLVVANRKSYQRLRPI